MRRALLAALLALGVAGATDVKLRPETPELEQAVLAVLESIKAPGVTLKLVKDAGPILRIGGKAPFNPDLVSRSVKRGDERVVEINPDAPVPREQAVRRAVLRELGLADDFTAAEVTARFGGADLNGDGKIDLSDFAILSANFGKTGSGVKGDLNGDGKVDAADVRSFAEFYTLP